MDYRRITIQDDLYAQECDLRERVLLSDAGYSLQAYCDEQPGREERYEHFVAVLRLPEGEERVVGCALLLPDLHDEDGNPIGKLAQMAVDPQRQGEGIGRRLVIELEKRAFAELGLTELYCHAQVTALGFYESLGWSIDSDLFVEAGIDHYRMRSPGGVPRPVA